MVLSFNNFGSRISIHGTEELGSDSFTKRDTLDFFQLLTFLHLHASFSFLLDLIDTLADFFHGNRALFLLFGLCFWRFVCAYDSAAVNAADNIEHFVVFFKLFERPRTLDEASLSVAQLPKLVVTPEEECAELKRSECVATTTAQLIDHKRPLVGAIIQLRDVRHEAEVVQVRRPVDPQLASKIVSATIDKLVDRFVILQDLCLDDCVFLTSCRVYDEFVFKFTQELGRLKNGMDRIVRVLVAL